MDIFAITSNNYDRALMINILKKKKTVERKMHEEKSCP